MLRIWQWVAIAGPVTGSEGDDGSGRRSILDNNLSGSAAGADVTAGGSAGTATDSYLHSGSGFSKTDDFNDTSLGGWQTVDLDDNSSTSIREESGQLIIDAGGVDTWKNHDQYAAVFQDNISGDFDFRLNIAQQTHIHNYSKTGIMVRNEIKRNGVSEGYCVMSVTPGYSYSFLWDSNSNGYLDKGVGTSSWVGSPVPTWIRLKKEGQTFTGYYGDTNSSDESDWTQQGTVVLSDAATVQDVGIFNTSHSDDATSLCKFDAMSLTADNKVSDPDLAFDDDHGTSWIYPGEPSSSDKAWIQFKFGVAKEIKGYTITGGHDSPDDWTLEGSNDGVSWDKLDSVGNAGLTSGNSTVFFCDTSGSYTHYRFLISGTKNSSANGMDISEIQLMEAVDFIPNDATLTDYAVRVKVCDSSAGLEANSKPYPSGGISPSACSSATGNPTACILG